MSAKPLVLVQRGTVPCQTCGHSHDAYREEGSKMWGSWKSLEDGHLYEAMSAEQICERFDLSLKDTP